MEQLEVMKRLDQFDYEMFGIEDSWRLGPTINMLTSFEMDMKGYFVQDNRATIFDKIYRKYWTYITGVMLKGLLPYATYHEPEDFMIYREDGIDIDIDKCIREFNTTFSKEAFFKYIEADDKVNIDALANSPGTPKSTDLRGRFTLRLREIASCTRNLEVDFPRNQILKIGSDFLRVHQY